MTSGILNVNKPFGLSSFDVVSLVRRGSGVRRVGHAGTLDPLATGILLVCLGRAVRVSEYLMELPKTYRATITLGRATDTYDAEGQTTFEADASAVTQQAIESALARFVGEIQQSPPPFSAVKVAGRRAYTLARRGESVALAERPVRIYSIYLLRFDSSLAVDEARFVRPEERGGGSGSGGRVSKERTWHRNSTNPQVEIEVQCGKGTYIRSLANDLGQELGCGAHLASLTRTRIGPFAVESAISVEALDAAFAADTWHDLLQPIEAGVAHLPSLVVSAEQVQVLRHGQPLELVSAPGEEARCHAVDESGKLVAILMRDDEHGAWHPRKVFVSPEP